MDLESTSQLWAILIGVAVPFVTGLLVRKSYAKWLKALVAFFLAAVVGVVGVYLAGDWDGGAAAIILAVYGASQVTFWAVVNAVPGLKDWLYSLLNRDPA